MKIAVTGANGFIGRHVLAELAKKSVPCVAVDLCLPTQSDYLGATWVQLDLHQPPTNVYDKIGRPDVLIHLAWGGLPNYHSTHHVEKELPVQYQFLNELIHAGLPSLVVSGTCFEYGMQSGVLSEDLIPSPNNPYGVAKDSLRRKLESLKFAQPFNLIWARLFYMYGEGQSKTAIYSQLKDAVLRGDAQFNMSAGEQLRDYLPVTEVARELVQLAMLRQDIGTVNICSGKPVSVRELVEQWLAENGWKIKLNLGYYSYPDYEPMAFWGSRARIDLIEGKFHHENGN